MRSSEVHPIPFEQLEQAVLPIVAVAGDARWHPIGTAFVVAVPNPKTALLLTAAHNIRFVQSIDAPRNRHHATTLSDFRSEPRSCINFSRTYVHVVVRNGPKIVLAEMVRSWCMDAFDVALMLVRLGDDENVDFQYRSTLDSRPIDEGTPIIAVGYTGMTSDFTAPPNYETEDFQGKLSVTLETRAGKVVKVCRQGAGINRWPGFLVDTPFDSGMSGGPVIDLSGAIPLVRGVVGADMSETLESGTRGSGAHAFASMLWPAMIMETEIALARDDGSPTGVEKCRLLDLAHQGIVDDHGRAYEHVKCHQTANGLKYSWIA